MANTAIMLDGIGTSDELANQLPCELDRVGLESAVLLSAMARRSRARNAFPMTMNRSAP